MGGKVSAEYHRNYYHTRVDKSRKQAVQLERRVRIRALVLQYKSENPCVICGFFDPRALEFHHRKPSQKEFTIANAIKGGWGIERIMREVAKCDVVCANCHAIIHFDERQGVG